MAAAGQSLSGPDTDDQETLLGILGQDWPDGALATYYPTGTKAPPLATLAPGPLYRSNTGAAVPYALPPLIFGEATKGVGIASPAGMDVILDWYDVTVT